MLGNTDDKNSHCETVKQEKTVTQHDSDDNDDDDDNNDESDSNSSDHSDTMETNERSEAKKLNGKNENNEAKVHKNKNINSKNRKRKLNESSKDKMTVQSNPLKKQQKIAKKQKDDRNGMFSLFLCIQKFSIRNM